MMLIKFVFHFLLLDFDYQAFRNFKIAQPCPRHMLFIHVSRDYLISTNTEDSRLDLHE